MKNVLLALLLVVFAAVIGSKIADAAAPSVTSYWRTSDYGVGNKGLGMNPAVIATSKTHNSKTVFKKGIYTCKGVVTVSCTFAIRNYFTVATGSVLRMFTIPVTGSTTIDLTGLVATVGAYHQDLTGATVHYYEYVK